MKKKQFMSKLAALTMAAAMGLTAVPATATSVLAATAVSAAPSPTDDQTTAAGKIQKAITDITIDKDADGTALATAINDADSPDHNAALEKTGLDKVEAAIKTLDGDASSAKVTFGSAAYDPATNTLQLNAEVERSESNKYDGNYTVTIDATVPTEDNAKKAIEDALKGLDLTYNVSLSQGKNEYNVKQAAEDVLADLDTGLKVKTVTYSPGNGGNGDSYTIAVYGTFAAGDYQGIVIGSANGDPTKSFDLAATSKDANILEDAAKALDTYKKEQTDAATTQEEVSDAVQSALDTYAESNSKNFDDVTFTIENFKKTDDKITADVVLKQGSATKTVKLNKAIDKTGLAGIALEGITLNNLKTTAAYNFTKDTDGVATGLDSDALAAAIKKAAETNLKANGYTNAVANVTITTYEANDNTAKGTVGDGYAAGTVSVTRNGETSSTKIFTINAKLEDGSYVLDQTQGTVHNDGDNELLQKSDNQKIASAVETLDKKIKKDATLGVKNGDNKNVPLTKKEVLSKATDKINETLGDEDVTLKLKTNENGKTVTPGETDADAIVVKSYTAPTTEAEGTAVITVNYNRLIDGKTAGSETASDYVAASHDITLTFPKLSARKTSAIDVKDSTSKIELTMNATDTTDAKDYFKFNGNSALTWSSSDESVFTVDADGNLSPVGIGEATLTVAVADNDSVKATKTVKVTGTTAFKDVQNPKAWYYNAIYKLANTKNAKKDAIVQGISKDEFGVSAPITRAQFVTFLYRLADEPAVTATTQFTDVDASAYYAKAVAWAVQKGITDGKTDTTFDPNATVSRAEAVTFLYRYKGEPDYNSNIVTAFTDLNSSAYYYDAVQWATGTVTNGKTSTTFAPNDPCTRAEGITMIYRTNPIDS